jgi:multiple sugar transport system substrate-binding protein
MESIKGFVREIAIAGLVLASPIGSATAADKPLEGVTLTLASQNDQFAAVLAALAPKFKEQTGGYDLITMDIVWSGQYAQNNYSIDLTDWIKRDASELRLDDIYPTLLNALGHYGDKQVAFPFAGYANVLAYRKDLFEAAGLSPPKTMEELTANAYKLTDPAKHQYGFVANGQKGPAVAQDWMQYNTEMGGSILGPDAKPVLNSEANVKSLTVYRDLFQKAAPPGAVNYDWGGREESFRQGLVAQMQTWSVGAPGYYDPASSKIVDKVAIAPAPRGAGLPQLYGIGGWGLAINADIKDRQKQAAWAFIKWLDSPAIHKEFNLMGAGSFLRRSEMTDADLLAKFPFLPVIAVTFEHGDGEYRPRIPQYPQIQDILGTAVNSVLVGNSDPKGALDTAQQEAVKLF